MNNLVVPPTPNWFESKILACSVDNTLIYGAKTEIVVIEPQPWDKPANIKVIPNAHYERYHSCNVKYWGHYTYFSYRVLSVEVNKDWGIGNKWVVSAGQDKIVKLWNIESYTCKNSHNTHAVCFLKSGLNKKKK